VKKILLEALLVGLAGLLVALTANALSPRGLKISRNYFPGDTGPRHVAPPTSTNLTTNATGQVQSAAATAAAARLREKGLEIADSAQAEALFNDPRYQQGLIVFIDARDDAHYQQGHIPGAYQMYPYLQEKYLPALMPALQPAQHVLVYCKGGECEDSEFAALMLRDSLGVSREKLLVYVDGITDWQAKKRPVETGPRNSGLMQKAP
jgi:rhodanese-related sulfurtransferase